MQVFGICKGLRKNLKWMRGLITMINENEKKKKKLNKLQWFKTFKMVLKNRKNEKHQQPKVRKNNSYKETYKYL